MSLVERLLARLRASSADEAFYEYVVEELKGGTLRPGLWAKALTLSGGDEQSARVLYMRMRVEQLMAKAPDLFALMQQLAQAQASMAEQRQRLSETEMAENEANVAVQRACEERDLLDRQLGALGPALNRRSLIRSGAAVFGSVCACAVSVLSDSLRDQPVALGSVAWFGVFGGGVAGVVTTVAIQKCNGRMRQLDESVSRLRLLYAGAVERVGESHATLSRNQVLQQQLAETCAKLEAETARIGESVRTGVS